MTDIYTALIAFAVLAFMCSLTAIAGFFGGVWFERRQVSEWMEDNACYTCHEDWLDAIGGGEVEAE